MSKYFLCPVYVHRFGEQQPDRLQHRDPAVPGVRQRIRAQSEIRQRRIQPQRSLRYEYDELSFNLRKQINTAFLRPR
jgi:hypothetical protein